MKNLNAIKKRYLEEPVNRRLGHLASDLNRISVFLENSINIKAVGDILEESKFFIEWVAPESPSHIKTLLSEMQPKLALWQHRLLLRKLLPFETAKLSQATKKWSLQLVRLSGLLVS